MKPNLLVVNPCGSEPSPWVEALCNQWMEDCYVYLLCSGCGFREDNEQGVRFLPHDGEAIPAFGQLDAVVAFGTMETEAIQRLRESYPDVPVRWMDPAVDAMPVHDLAA